MYRAVPPTALFILTLAPVPGNPILFGAGRKKVPFAGITQNMIKKMMAATNLPPEAKVPGTGRGGGPNFATVKPFDGWHLKKYK